jgi:hypothetical protein
MAANKEVGNAVEMRDAFGQGLVELGRQYPKMITLDADLHTSSKATMFKKAHPERFIQVGIAEQNLFGISAGLALSGFMPFPFNICGVCNAACARPDCHLDLFSKFEREDSWLLRGLAHQPGRCLAQLHRGHCRHACAAEYARG